MKRSLRHFWFGVVVVCLTVAVFCGTCEMLFRLVGSLQGYLGDDPRFNIIASDPVRLMVLKKNYHGRVFNKQGEFDVEFTTNAEGMPAGAVAMEKKNGTRRIVLLGDSFIAGAEVPMNRRIHFLLQQKFNAGHEVPNIEVLPFGVPGYSAAHEYLDLRDEVLQFHPDVVVHFAHPNDISDNLYMERISVMGQDGLPVGLKPVQKVKSFLRWNSLFYAFLQERVHMVKRIFSELRAGSGAEDALIEHNFVAVYKKDYSREDSSAWSVESKYLRAMQHLCQDQGIPFVVVTIPLGSLVGPDEWQVGAPYWFSGVTSPLDSGKMDTMFGSFCRSEHIPFLPLLTVFRNYKNLERTEKLYFDFDGHWTLHGHAVAADSLYAFLRTDPDTRRILGGGNTDR